MNLLMFAASLSKDSCNKKLIAYAANLAQAQGATVDLADFATFCAPLYNADMQKSSGFPTEITAFATRLQAANGLVIASPEYNFSIPGTLKNLIDWVSRLNPIPWKNYPILLMSASPSLVGGNRGLWNTRMPLEACGSFVFSDMFSLANAYAAFDDQGNITDNNMTERLKSNLSGFIAYATKLNKGF